MLYAALGPIIFESAISPESFSSAVEYHYAEHEVIEAPPRLQWLTNKLEELALEMIFHTSFTTPTLMLLALRAAAEFGVAYPLVFGNGMFRGWFVITKITERAIKHADDGSIIAVAVAVELRQWVQAAEIDPNAPPIPGFAPLGLAETIAPGLTAAMASVAPSIAPGLDFTGVGLGEILRTDPAVTTGVF